MVDYSVKAPGVYVEHVVSGSAPIAGAGTSTAGFIGIVPDTIKNPDGGAIADVGDVKLITNFTEFKDAFGDFSTDADHNILAHAVYGFFNNGGTRCYVTRVKRGSSTTSSGTTSGSTTSSGTTTGDTTSSGTTTDGTTTGDTTSGDTSTVTTFGDTSSSTNEVSIVSALELLEPIEEIAIVAAPGLTTGNQQAALVTHCRLHVNTRFAILDTAEVIDDYGTALAKTGASMPATSDSAAVYFPWIQVYDPASEESIYVPPSGHIAGLYARVDGQRGVHKAPANEVIFGATGLRYAISARQQDGLNPHGVNCLRKLNGNIRVWGARTVGGSANTEFMYVNVRRLFNYLRASIERGTQWAVFEPNDAALWAKITRNLSAFLTTVWQSGALFGATAEEAFYVKCDAETNPPAKRELGQVVTEVGVAITRPAEFVVFRLGQKTAS